ncbi:MAG: hypothetical protein FIB07_05720 [Candidatus Methanoperedens sp.]|nr:hypothetical protein [Candidatus Methanoperedens sp.]
MVKNIMMILAIFMIITSIADASEGSVEKVKFSTENNSTFVFSKIYVDGFGVNSNGFKLILRTYERRMETSYQPFLADIEYALIDSGGQVVYSKKVEQIPLSTGVEGVIILEHHGNIALEEDKNYEGVAKVYLYNKGIPEYYLTAQSSFTARNDAEITEVYGDSIGASATIKSTSMVPLDGKIIFTLKKGSKIVETRETDAPHIMSNDKEKTVNILWPDNLDEGTYMVSVILNARNLTVNYDKIFNVDNRTVPKTPGTTNQSGLSGGSDYSASGFTIIWPVLAIAFIVLINNRRN